MGATESGSGKITNFRSRRWGSSLPGLRTLDPPHSVETAMEKWRDKLLSRGVANWRGHCLEEVQAMRRLVNSGTLWGP